MEIGNTEIVFYIYFISLFDAKCFWVNYLNYFKHSYWIESKHSKFKIKSQNSKYELLSYFISIFKNALSKKVVDWITMIILIWVK